MSRRLLVVASVCVALSLAMLSGHGRSAAPPAADPADPFGPGPAVDDPFAEKPLPGPEKPKGGEKPPAKPQATAPKPRPAGALAVGEQAVLKALEGPAALDCTEAALADVLDDLRYKHLVAIHLDKKALEDVGIGLDTPITFSISGVPLRSALGLMLKELNLTWTIKSGVLLITTEEEAESILVTKTYDVGDLLAVAVDRPYRGKGLPTGSVGGSLWPEYSCSPAMGMGGMGGIAPPTKGAGGGMFNIGGMDTPFVCGTGCASAGTFEPTPLDELIEVIERTIAPTTWDNVGGPGSISPYQRFLVINQTTAIHLQVESLLSDLRAKRRAVSTLAVELQWLWLDAKQVAQLAPAAADLPAGRTSLAVDPKALEQLAGEVPGYRGRVACASGQLVHLVSGERRSAVVSAVPVIGSGVGYQPVIDVPNVGVLAEVRPTLADDARSALLDVRSAVTRWGKQDPPVRVGAEWPRGEVQKGEGEPQQWPAGSTSVAVDRPNMPAQEWAATARVPLGKPVLLAGLSFPPADDAPAAKTAGESKQLCLVATLSVAE